MNQSVFVINQNGRALMPTTPRKAKLLLKSGKAEKVGYRPFTIKLLYGTRGYVQPISLGIDAGYLHVGFSAVSESKELVGGELDLLPSVSERITEKARYRRVRRGRLRYRAPRFDNRERPEGWLAPSIQHKYDAHLRLIERITSRLPISKITIELAPFDIQKILNPEIEGTGYQQGEQLGYANLAAYIRHRDGYHCQNPDCKNKSKDKILQIHHLGYWKQDRTNRPGNLITLCDKCHVSKNHQPNGFLYGWQPKIKSFKAETFMSTIYAYSHDFGLLSIFGDPVRNLKNIRVGIQTHQSHGTHTASASQSNQPESAKLESGYDGTTDHFECIFNPDQGSLPAVSLPNPSGSQPL
jgi:hypothetical protein